jgi:predicted permease
MGKLDDDLEREIRDHLELEAEERGGSLSAARRAFGNATLIKEDVRAVWTWTAFERFMQDLRYGLRLFRRSPGFSIVAVLTLALGIGANTAIFSVVNGVLLRPLPFPKPDRLVRLWESVPAKGVANNVVEPFNFIDWRARSRSFEGMAAIMDSTMNLTGVGEPLALPGLGVTPEFFSILGVPPLYGRGFLTEEGVPGANGAVVLGYGVWQSHFGGNRGILGTKIVVNGAPSTVVGIMPPGFSLPKYRAELWFPLPLTRTKEWQGGRFLGVVARMKAGVTIQQAQDEMTGIGKQLSEERPFNNKGWNVAVVPALADATEGVRLPLLVLLGAVGFVLLIACANVANLLLMRASGRLREVAIRAALGAGKRRILQQLLSESLLLAIAGWAAGLLFGAWALKGLLAIIPRNTPLPRMDSVHLDGRVFTFAFAIAVLTAVIFGLVPALHVSRLELQDALKQGSSRAGLGRNRAVRKAFVVTEIGLALLLLVGAGLMLRSFARLISVQPGFEPERVLTMNVFLSPARFTYSDKRSRSQYIEQILTEVRGVPGVRAAGSIHMLPLTGRVSGSCFGRVSEPPPSPASSPSADFLVISPGYFQAMATPMLSGRAFGEQDHFGSPSAIVINDAFSKRVFPGENPIGKRLNLCWTIPNPAEIVGVVANARQKELANAPQPTIFVANAQAPMYFATLVARAASDPRQIARSIESAVHRVNPEQAISDVQTMDEVFSNSVAQPRFQLVLLAVFAGIAVVLAGVGVYGVVSYSVTQRTQEIGVRVALGARRSDVAGLVMREGLLLAVMGLAAGLAGAFALTRLLETLLFEVTPTDPATLVSVSVLLLLLTLVAIVVPVRRAMKVDPMVALRYE